MFFLKCCVQRTIPPIHQNPSRIRKPTARPYLSSYISEGGYRLKSPFVILKTNTFSSFSQLLHSPPFTVCRTSPKSNAPLPSTSFRCRPASPSAPSSFFFLHGSNSLRLKRLLPAIRTTSPVSNPHRPARLLRKTYVPGGSTLPFSALPKLFASPPLRSTPEPPPFNLKCSFVGSPRSFLGANSFLFLCDEHIITRNSSLVK